MKRVLQTDDEEAFKDRIFCDRSKWRVRQICSNQWRLVQVILPSLPFFQFSKMILILKTLNLKQAGTTYWYTLKITFATCLLISIGSRWISSEDREGEEKRLLIIVASSTVFLLAVHRLIKDLAILSTADQVIAIISILYEMFSSQSRYFNIQEIESWILDPG